MGGHEKGPATGAIGLRAAAISALLALGLACSKGEHQGPCPRYPGTGEGRTYANYVCVLRVMRVFHRAQST